ncbi:ABC transporter ATP-binding protein [Bradyrhizobium sp. U87765 SZCCT0131]|uniref:ABC transporter ATP-binding protein n=1 Tax=unclassified Bradyrhizobium TaxID=2631580 RepID=UPI001BA7578E|nr:MULTISPECIES: ABC transporter ATP-binding protein [unclassified Bradyrhizobium]MBR1218897.1 ABC transporter ATP-binding protein [Bradyrhizobium sp. U87765 SZCCT0131]MBR1261548.1 ABC transporter ATP-binding protein [Bradyrhizobium sp. U87765 SZCCT0134]MBR1306599.1 ABC transporter ATP-binding protein [Bradyrhizobium sp. U87765 SZCCT0110]MBR1317330.1 ABC transporter ATP-binding protein [Bradyrhizobium sp. U87765 SZCCT0109]MBR1351032.1 ABC transporter ATP-binding protein [Bradyrhizobium sp. U87
MSNPLLEVCGLAVGYGDVQVVWQADLTVAQGSVVALIGSNGAGKTTILRALSGLLTPSAGEIRLDGKTVEATSPVDMVRRGVVHVPEGRRLFASLSVHDNLMLGAYLRSDRDGIARDIEHVFTLFPRLRERRRQDASTLSGGEQQMCAIGRGLMASPRLLLIDELSLGLAPKVVDELIAALRQVNAAGTSLLVVEQDVATALEFADHAYVIDQGRTVAGGTADAIGRDPAVRAAYLGL